MGADLDRGPRSVLHGDPHPGNVYLLGDGVGLLDWQAVRRATGCATSPTTWCWACLPTYAVSTSATFSTTTASGCVPPAVRTWTATATWFAYRRMAGYAYVAAIFTLGLGGLQDDAISDVGARRAATAIADLETAAALG